MNSEIPKKTVKFKRLLILAAVLLALLAVNLAIPKKKIPPYVGVRTLKDLAELATVKAGIDLNELTAQDIKLDNESSVTISLTAPKILLFNMKPENMREIFNESGVLRSDFSNQEKDGLLSQGEKDIRAKVATMDILQRTGRNARILIESWLEKMGFTAVHIVFKGKGGGHEKNSCRTPDSPAAGHPVYAL